jgi:mannan polymerase complexes MNN9 subunit
LKRANPFTLALGTCLCIFILYFLLWPSGGGGGSSDSSATTKPTNHYPLSPPTSPFQKQSFDSNGVPAPPPVTRYNLNNVTITSRPIENKEHVLILTPMARFYQGYWDNLLKLSYPHDLITVGFILPKTKEGNAATSALQAQITKTQKSSTPGVPFKSIIILRQDFDPPIPSQDEKERHKMQNQKPRRAAMSKARNSLLFTTLGPQTSWVLWLDADIIETPANLIQDLASHDKAIITPNCYQRYFDNEQKRWAERAYDFNNWVDSPTAQELAAKLGPDDILLEGYAEVGTYRALMAYMAKDGNDLHEEVALDGVGGTALLVKADVHRDGAMFPAFPFYHLIETEGFAKMASRLGWKSTGLPNYKVRHMCTEVLGVDGIERIADFPTRFIITTSRRPPEDLDQTITTAINQ